MLKGEHIMDKNKNVRLGLIELWKNKARTLGYTQKEVDERNNGKMSLSGKIVSG